MKMIHPAPIMGKLANITNDIVHRTLKEMINPQTNIAKRLNMLPIFSPVAF